MTQANAVAPWSSSSRLPALDGISEPAQIVSYAINLREKERTQIVANLQGGNYELASSYIWVKSMSLLKQNLASMGMDFIAELLQRPDISSASDPSSAVSDSEAIELAYELGAISATQKLRLLNSGEVVNHFASSLNANEDDADMTAEEAIGCVKVCVQAVLGIDKVEAAQDFYVFRRKLSEESIKPDSAEVRQLMSSPYFFKKTTVGMLINILKNPRGASLENGGRNAQVIIPMLWPDLKGPERWQIGQAYAEMFNEGRTPAVKVLHAILVATRGFDFVPESLRSESFARAAHAVLAAHQGFNNFYNEPKPMQDLANMGSSIPGPALAICLDAILAVKLGNQYGVSHAAQADADRLVSSISGERWEYFLTQQLANDSFILRKLTQTACVHRWLELWSGGMPEVSAGLDKRLIALLAATRKGDVLGVKRNAESLLKSN